MFNEAVDAQPSNWEHTVLRLDLLDVSSEALEALGIGVGSLVSIDSQPVVTETGFVTML